MMQTNKVTQLNSRFYFWFNLICEEPRAFCHYRTEYTDQILTVWVTSTPVQSLAVWVFYIISECVK